MVSSRDLASKAAAPPGRGEASPVEATAPPPPSPGSRRGDADAHGGGGTQEYERRRDERIRENMERMQRLGIVDLALKFRSSISGGSKRAYNKFTPSPGFTPRRSSRLQNVTSVGYSEIHTDEHEAPEKKIRIEGPVEEVYTDEHEKLLGTCETSWSLFVDGYSKDGVRIYEPVKGKTCHQCRQKTLGHRTNCSKCKLVQGQFCGDCLYMRYGENVLEANKNQNWICPVCRGICNCSLCRTKKGWPPTGLLYKKKARVARQETKVAEHNTQVVEEVIQLRASLREAKKALIVMEAEKEAACKRAVEKFVASEELAGKFDEVYRRAFKDCQDRLSEFYPDLDLSVLDKADTPLDEVVP